MQYVNKWLVCVAVACFAPILRAEPVAGAAGFEVPEVMRSIGLFPIKAPPGADQSLMSVTKLPLQRVSDSHWMLPKGEYKGNYVVDVPIHLECEEGV